MGMSSSQARLLTLTARMHDIEFRAQRIQADKLRLANESDKVYATYLEALDAQKLQYKSIMADGSIEFRDANLKIMENRIVPGYVGETAYETLFLQDTNGKIVVTSEVAQKYNLTETGNETRDMDTYIHDVTHKDKTAIPHIHSANYPNTLTNNPDLIITHSYTPAENIEGGIDYSELENYAKFDDSHDASSPVSQIDTTIVSAIAGDYVIKDAAGLKALADYSQTNSITGVNIVIDASETGGVIDMSGYTNWQGINGFTGTFDGNGYVISGLTGSQGLFSSTSGATIKNIGLENINITGNSDYVGGLIGYAYNTNIENCYTTGTVTNSKYTADTPDYTQTSPTQSAGTGGLVGGTHVKEATVSYSNVYTNTNVICRNSSGNLTCESVGGLLGSVWSDYNGSIDPDFNLENCYTLGNVEGKKHVGGLIGRAWYDQDNGSAPTDIKKAYAAGNVTGEENVGGFAGDFLYWGDGSDNCVLTECMAGGTVSGTNYVGAFIGKLHIKNATSNDSHYIVNIIDSGYSTGSGLSGYGIVEDTKNPGTDVKDEYLADNESGQLIEFNIAGTLPSIDETDGSGAYMSNILGVFTKADLFDVCEHTDRTPEQIDEMKSKVADFLDLFDKDSKEDNEKLFYLNQHIYNYLSDDTNNDTTFANQLFKAVNNGSVNFISSYTSGGQLEGTVKRGNGEEWTPSGVHELIPGKVNIPSINTIADEVFAQLNKRGSEKTQADVRSWFSAHYGSLSQENKITLANINDKINNNAVMTELLDAIETNGTYTNNDNYDLPTNPWIINVSATDSEVINTTYTYKWDTTDPEIAQAMVMWKLAQRGIVIATEEQASKKEYLINMLESGAVLTTFDPTKVSELEGLSEEEIQNMDDYAYNKLVGIEHTSVAVETSLREVSNEENLKKAEAQYEADMKKIDRKDARYDTQLAACDNERNAIKAEMDTLKNVAKDNVDRTFKLFS